MATNEPKDRPREAERAGEKGPPGAKPPEMMTVPEPDAEEAPELLGERSDYPIAYGEGDDGHER